MSKEKHKNYQEIKKSNDKMMTKETQNVLFGILIFLLCLIGLLENGGPLGSVIRYIFVFLLGTFFPFALIIGCIIGLVLFVKRELKPVRLGLTSWSGVIFAISLLVLSSENSYSLTTVTKEYRELFSLVDRGGLSIILDSSLGGGIIGYFIYTLVSSLVGDIGVKLVFFVLMLVFGYLFLKPLLFYFINLFTKHLNKRQNYERVASLDKSILPRKSLFKDELEIEEEISLPNKIKSRKDDQDENLFIDSEDEEEINESIFDKEKETIKSSATLEDLTDNDILLNKRIYKERFSDEVTPLSENKDFHEELFVPKKEVKRDTFDIFADSILNDEDVVKIRENKLINKIENEASKMRSFNIFEENIPTPQVKKEEKTEELTFAREIDIVEDMFKPYPSIRETEVKKEYNEENNLSLESKPFINESVFEQKEVKQETSFTPYQTNNFVNKEVEAVKETKVQNSYMTINKPILNSVETSQNTTTTNINPFASYQLPSLGLLEDIQDKSYFENKQNALIKTNLINEKLAALGIKGRVVDQHIAPAFTRYEIALDSAEKMNQFANLTKDLQSAVAAPSISILAPIPNSMNAGVDVPNAVRGMVGLKEVLSNISYDMPPLYVGIGKDSIGRVVGINLAETPHLLVAGSTGTGKSVCMNTLIISLLMHTRPDELKMVMIDPKRVEMASYQNIPHLACPVITDVRKAGVALQKVAKMMQERFKLFESLGAKNISAYNRMMKRQDKPTMPYYVVFIDEMADLFNHVKSAEQTLIEICSLARAAGIHVVCATQRPSADVITSNIKVNIPSRIAFAVSSLGDSKTVLGQSGAESLLGKGDMILNVPGQLSFVRAQGAYVSDEEIETITEFIKKQASPVYNQTLLDLEPEANSELEFDGSDSKDGDLANMVIEFIKKVAQVSTTKIQNRFGIGYPKAAKIMDMLNDKGIIMKDPATKLWVLSDTYMDEDVE